jgi:hypothetical protein
VINASFDPADLSPIEDAIAKMKSYSLLSDAVIAAQPSSLSLEFFRTTLETAASRLDGFSLSAGSGLKMDVDASNNVVISSPVAQGSDTSFDLTFGDKHIELKAGRGLIIEKKNDQVTEIRAETPAIIPYQTEVLEQGIMKVEIKWQKRDYMIHAQVTLNMGLGDAQAGQFDSKLLEAIRPATEVQCGDGVRNITISPDGTIKYYSYEMGVFYTSIVYFIGA